MLTLEQIRDESNATELEDEEVLALENLIKSYDGYARNLPVYPNLSATIAKERPSVTQSPAGAITVKTKGLRAVLTALGELPPVVVESNGTDKASSYFSTSSNWGALAQDALNILYEIPLGSIGRNFVLVQRRVQDLVLNDNQILKTQHTGRRY
jgi:hypothetical protein